jgi:hypothetical protein
MVLNLRDDYTNSRHEGQTSSMIGEWPRIANSEFMKEFWLKTDSIAFADLPQAIRMLEVIHSEEGCAADSPRLAYCYVCGAPKLARRAPSHECYDFQSGRCDGGQRSAEHHGALKNDFDFPCHWNETPCCKQQVCAACLIDSLEIRLKDDFWQHLEDVKWISCPVLHCDARSDLVSWPSSVINQFMLQHHPAGWKSLPEWSVTPEFVHNVLL